LGFEDLSNTDNFLKVPRSDTFKKLSGFYSSARRCTYFKKYKRDENANHPVLSMSCGCYTIILQKVSGYKGLELT